MTDSIELLEIIPLKGRPTDLPKAEVPHFILTSDALYLRKPTMLGTATIRQKDMPKHLKSFDKEFVNGEFVYDTSQMKIPAEIINQATSFFTKVYDGGGPRPDNKSGTEAEVLLLYNTEIKDFKIFVPWQVVSGASVTSIYDIADVPSGYDVIGSIHSHCNFSAFHSGTDTDDAESFSGLHITIGDLKKDEISFAAMVMVDGTPFNYNIETVANVSELKSDASFPEDWLKFLSTFDEIKKIQFKTLTKAQVDKWATPVSYDSFKIEGKSYRWSSWEDAENDSDNKWRNWYRPEAVEDWKKKTGNPDAKFKWSRELSASFPGDWFDPRTGNLREVYFKVAVEDLLSDLFDACAQHGWYLDYDINDMAESERYDPDEAYRESDLLPGAFEVKENTVDEEDDPTLPYMSRTLLD